MSGDDPSPDVPRAHWHGGVGHGVRPVRHQVRLLPAKPGATRPVLVPGPEAVGKHSRVSPARLRLGVMAARFRISGTPAQGLSAALSSAL